MSREEAIKTLKGEAWISCAEKWNEALDMAIRALEQEPILDNIRAEIKAMIGDVETISDVLDIIDKYRSESEE